MIHYLHISNYILELADLNLFNDIQIKICHNLRLSACLVAAASPSVI